MLIQVDHLDGVQIVETVLLHLMLLLKNKIFLHVDVLRGHHGRLEIVVIEIERFACATLIVRVDFVGFHEHW